LALKNISFIHGNSPQELRTLSSGFDNPLFWLDAHWSGGTTAGENDECPLLAELDAIGEGKFAQPVIIIDDARLFLSPPPPPHKWEQWPDIGTVLAALERCGDFYVVIKDDAIIAVPASARSETVEFLRNQEQPPQKKPKGIFGRRSLWQ
jgi:hypothetical protein